MLQCDQPGDFVIATGETHSVRDLVETAFGRVGLDPSKHVRTDPRFLRPTELEHLVGDASKAREQLGWRPHTTFEELIGLMVDSDLERLERASSRTRTG